jgi:hypothetical protein
MINFLRNRSLQGRGKKAAQPPATQSDPQSGPPQPAAAAPAASTSPPLVPEAEPAQPPDDAELAAAVEAAEVSGPVADALANAAEEPPERYEARQAADGWTVYDRVTSDTAEVYGYRLVKMNRARADSLVEVLNRGEARRRGRNG